MKEILKFVGGLLGITILAGIGTCLLMLILWFGFTKIDELDRYYHRNNKPILNDKEMSVLFEIKQPELIEK